MAIECCYNCKNYTDECLKCNCDKCDKYEKKEEKGDIESPFLMNPGEVVRWKRKTLQQ